MKQNRKIAIMVVYDHALARYGLRTLVESEGDMVVAAEAREVIGACRMFERYQPDITLVDAGVDDADGFTTAMRLIRNFPFARVIMLSASDAKSHIEQAVRAGAYGYVLKNRLHTDLINAIRAVDAGSHYFLF